MLRLVIIRATWGPRSNQTKTKLVYGRVGADGKTRISLDAYQSLYANAPRGVCVRFS
jgi:hypothetical protein